MIMTEMEQLDDIEYHDLEDRVAEARRALALIEQARHADTLPRRFDRLMEDMTAEMTDRDRAMAYKFAVWGKEFAEDAYQATSLALRNSRPDLLTGGRR